MAREAEALGRQSLLMPRGLFPRGVSLGARGRTEDVVFLLHGLMATAGVFVPLEQRLRAHGIKHVASFTYHPFRSVPSLATELRAACEAIPDRGRIHVVGHSLGGVVARYYAQELGGSRRLAQLITMASPFHGTHTVRRVPEAIGRMAPLLREIAPDSALLERLRQGKCPLPHTSIVAGNDLMVTPPESAVFPGSDVIVVDGVGHNGLLFDEGVARIICQRIVSFRSETEAAE